jgi:Flp pilus assembly protein TadG
MQARSRLHPARLAGRLLDPRGRSRGQALVEVALVLPVLLLILVAAGDLARVFSTQVSLDTAARAGALEASLHPTSFQAGSPCNADTNRVVCAVLTESVGASTTVSSSDITLECVPSPCTEALGNSVTVRVTGSVPLITPFLTPILGSQTVNVTSSATAQIAVRPNVSAPTPTPDPAATPTPTAEPTPTPTPDPTPTPTPDPSATPTPSPTPSPTPTPTPFCASPVADFTIGPSTGRKKHTLFQFTDLSTSAADCPLTWSWNFGDGAGDSLSTLQNPVHQYQTQGVFTVTLVASNFGGSATRVRSVTVTP